MTSITKEIITTITKPDFMTLLNNNPGLVVVKFGATWCKPCKKIAPLVEAFFATSPANVVCADLDVDDENVFGIYGMFQHAKILKGVPGIICFAKGSTNLHFSKLYPVPDVVYNGGSLEDLDVFFKKCGAHLTIAAGGTPVTVA